MTTTKTTHAAWRRLTATIVGAGAITAGVMAMSVPTASAQQSEARAECGSHDSRDVYTTTTVNGHTVETCCYKSGLIVELTRCAKWIDGKWVSTTRTEEPTTTPPKPGGPPPIGSLPKSPNEGVSSTWAAK